MTNLTQARLRELLHYDPETGIFTRLATPGYRGNYRAGTASACVSTTGYVVIRVDGRLYVAHRLAWLYVHGELPPEDVDHIDANRTNNKLSNLRLATRSQNMQNQRKPRKDNTSGFLGVTFDSKNKRWRAQLQIDGKNKGLGRYATPEAAHAAYLKAKVALHPFQTLVNDGVSQS